MPPGLLTGVMEEKRIVRLRILYKPVHCAQNIGHGRLACINVRVIRQNHHVFPPITKVLIEVVGHVLDVVDATPELSALPEVIDADKQRLSSSSTR